VVAAKSGSFSLMDFGGTFVTGSDGSTSLTPPAGLNVTTFLVNFTSRTVSASAISLGTTTNTFSAGPFSVPINIHSQGAFVELHNHPATCSGGICSTSTPATIGMTGIFMGRFGDHLGTSWNARTTSGPSFLAQVVRLFGCSPGCP
jgi:hypothetical protein